MITKENTLTLGDLIENAAVDYENQVFIRYEKEGIVYEKGYRTYAMDTRAVSHWTMNKCGELGKKLHVALIGKCSYEYLTVLMGVAAAGSIAIPMDVQLSKEGFIENLKRFGVNFNLTCGHLRINLILRAGLNNTTNLNAELVTQSTSKRVSSIITRFKNHLHNSASVTQINKNKTT